MPIIHVADPEDPRLADYRDLANPDRLLRRGLFVAENRLVVRALLAAERFRARSLLLTAPALESLRDALADGVEGLGPCSDRLPVYVCPKSLIEPLAGYNIHRGCLAIGERPAGLSIGALLALRPAARLLVVLEALTNADNVGGIFRTAAAFAVDGIVVGPRCCDPLYRKALRVSIGASLQVPFAHGGEWPADLDDLRRRGFAVVALTPSADAIDLDRFAADVSDRPIALLVGNEGEGLSDVARATADARVRIAMAPGVDSLNAAAAAAIALHRLATV